MILVDTGVWYAAYVVEDPDHLAAQSLLKHPGQHLATSDYIIDELLTLLLSRGHRHVANYLGHLLWSESICSICWVTKADILDAWKVFTEFHDKNWSFTDCVSYAQMKRLE